jgi:hypothetical protein
MIYALCIKHIYPGIDEQKDFIIKQPNEGVQIIDEWNYSEPIPTDQQLLNAWYEIKNNLPTSPKNDKEQMAYLLLQSAQKDAKITTLEKQNAKILLRLAMNGIL